jgi:hypothetical protein
MARDRLARTASQEFRPAEVRQRIIPPPML